MKLSSSLIQKWALQYLLMAIVLCPIFSTVQFIKGQTLEYALQFGLIWSLITSTVFLLARYKGSKKSDQ